MPSSKYDGTSDPDDHVAPYEGLSIHIDRDSLDMVQEFEARHRERTTGELLSVKQGENESLRDFIGRFNVEAVSIPRLQKDVAMSAFMMGLKEGSPFRSYLGRKTYTSLGPVLGKANDFIRGEEFDRAVSKREPEKKKEDKQRKEKGRESDRGRDDRRLESNVVKRGNDREKNDRERYDRDRGDREGGGRDKGERKERFDAYNQRTTSRSQIYLMNKDSDKWQLPKQMFHKNRNKSKWCDFHGDHGHLTEDYQHLKDNLEDLVRRGYFSQYKA
ncbi:uncharacterized protein LOC104900917 [Beta vulgaris subsp. vulgaris]|uniref:uncharacterized protein LOC104900917 n=1 Tax=Beta vulgaris subsp. vulgaris TaxID=3555 RepID=UPI00053F9F17|nr:uncharacterized protein LOC104900917 [Beta vulgaris subsp. vulgaris]